MSEDRKGKNNFDNSQFVKDIEKILKELDNEAVIDELDFSFHNFPELSRYTAQAVRQQRHVDDVDDKDEDIDDADRNGEEVGKQYCQGHADGKKSLEKILHLLENRNLSLKKIEKEVKAIKTITGTLETALGEVATQIGFINMYISSVAAQAAAIDTGTATTETTMGGVTSQVAVTDADAATTDVASEETAPGGVETQAAAINTSAAAAEATPDEAASQTAIIDTDAAKPARRRTAKSQPKSL